MKPVNRAYGWSTLRALCRWFFLAATALVLGPVFAGTQADKASAETDVLEPERAFQLTASHSAKSVELHYKIADGYYLYRARFKIAVEPNASAKLGKPRLPKGTMKQDPTFGRVETYRNSVHILLPLATIGKQTGRDVVTPVRLKVTSQGCADAGVCYPPLHQYLTLRPGVTERLLPDSVASGSDLAGRLQSIPQAAPHTLTDTLGKSK